MLTEGGVSACHGLLFHSYLHSPAAFTTLVSLCGHTDTQRLNKGTNHKKEVSFFMLFISSRGGIRDINKLQDN